MVETLLDESLHIKPKLIALSKKVGASSTVGDYVLYAASLDTDKAIQIVDGSIEVDEELLRPNTTYPVELNGETFYIRKMENGLEIFQLSE